MELRLDRALQRTPRPPRHPPRPKFPGPWEKWRANQTRILVIRGGHHFKLSIVSDSQLCSNTFDLSGHVYETSTLREDITFAHAKDGLTAQPPSYPRYLSRLYSGSCCDYL